MPNVFAKWKSTRRLGPLRDSVQENQAVSESSPSHLFKISMKLDGSSFIMYDLRGLDNMTWAKLWRSATMHLTPTPKIVWISGTLPLKEKKV